MKNVYQVQWMADDVEIKNVSGLTLEEAKIACFDGQLHKDVNFVFMAINTAPIFRAYKIGNAWKIVAPTFQKSYSDAMREEDNIEAMYEELGEEMTPPDEDSLEYFNRYIAGDR